MDMEYTLAAIKQDRDAAFVQRARERDARASVPVVLDVPAPTSRVLARAGASIGRFLMRPRLSRPQA